MISWIKHGTSAGVGEKGRRHRASTGTTAGECNSLVENLYLLSTQIDPKKNQDLVRLFIT
jgi:hypothetical protein